MAKMKFDLFKITALTNMHVGSGDINFGVVDNLVQRDVSTELPTIHASSLKGALREFFEQQEPLAPDLMEFVFGAPPTRSGSSGAAGNYKFFSANLLSIPVRSNKKPFFRAVSPVVLKEFLENIERFGVMLSIKDKIKNLVEAVEASKDTPFIFTDLGQDIIIEDTQAEYRNPSDIDLSAIETVLGQDMALFHDADFIEICSDLPVVARNYLENGQSKNLWYEEVVPRQTLFYFFMARPESDTNGYYSDFIKKLTKNIIQIGANATIGYGFTKIEKIDLDIGGEDEKAG